jgi:hypothetical protein
VSESSFPPLLSPWLDSATAARVKQIYIQTLAYFVISVQPCAHDDAGQQEWAAELVLWKAPCCSMRVGTEGEPSQTISIHTMPSLTHSSSLLSLIHRGVANSSTVLKRCAGRLPVERHYVLTQFVMYSDSLAAETTDGLLLPSTSGQAAHF